MILTDLYCPRCNATLEDVDASPARRCECGEMMRVACVGGTKNHRFRANDWPRDPRFYRGQAKISTAHVGQYADDGSGRVIPSSANGTGRHSEDAQAERRDRVYSDADRAAGHAPMIVDMKARTAV